MNKSYNAYLYNQTTLGKSRKYISNNNELISKPKFIYDYKRNIYFQGEIFNKYELLKKYINNNTTKKPPLYTSLNQTNSSSQKSNFYNPLNLNNDIIKNKKLPVKKQKEIINNDIQSYSHLKKNRKYQRYNSLAYIKKRPNDLIKNQNSDNDNSTINNQFLRNSYKIKGRCLSYNNINNSHNILNNNDIKGNDIDNNKSNTIIPFGYPFETKNEKIDKNIKIFSVNSGNKNILCNSILKIIKKHLISDKIIFFNKIFKKNKMYEVSYEEYKFLEELKSLGVTNKKELNLLLKDIFISIKGNDEINKNENRK